MALSVQQEGLYVPDQQPLGGASLHPHQLDQRQRQHGRVGPHMEVQLRKGVQQEPKDALERWV